MSSSEQKQGLEYWVRWQVPVCALILVVPSILAIHFIKKSKSQPLNLNDLRGSRWKRLNPLWLLLYRAFAFVFLAQLLYEVVASHGPFVFYFYTQWSFALVVVYFALATIVSAYGYWVPVSSKKPSSENEEEAKILDRDSMNSETTKFNASEEKEIKGRTKLQTHYAEIHQNAGILGNLMQISYLTSAGALVLTDVVFWCLLVPFLTDDNFHVDLLMGLMHSVNAIFLLVDTILNSLPFPWFGFLYFVLWSCVYIVFQWIMHACGFTWWPYPFLELNTAWAPFWYICLALVHIPCYGLYAQIVNMKNSLLPRLFPHSFVK